MARILIKFPTRGRRKLFSETLLKWRKMLSGKHDVLFLIAIDEDDAAMNTPEVLDRLRKHKDIEVQVAPGTGSKIEAINRGVVLASSGADVVILAADDFVPQIQGYDDEIIKTFGGDYNKALWYRDGLQPGEQDEICTLPIIGASIIQRWGFLYHPDYRSVYADNEYTDVLFLAGLFGRIATCIIRHDWAASDNQGKPDILKARNEAPELYAADKATYERRKAEGFQGTAITWELRYQADKAIPQQVVEIIPQQQSSDVDPLDELGAPAAKAPPAPPGDDTKVLASTGLPRMSVLLQLSADEKGRKHHASAANVFVDKWEQYDLQVIEGTDRRKMLARAVGNWIVIIPTGCWTPHTQFVEIISGYFGGNPDVITCAAEAILEGAEDLPKFVDNAAHPDVFRQKITSVFNFKIEFLVPSRVERGTALIYRNIHANYLCPTKREILVRLAERDARPEEDFFSVANGDRAGSIKDLIRWAQGLAASRTLRMENHTPKSCYQQIG